jgi:glutamine amidotransferase
MIAIVDYGLGNIKAFANVYKKLNIDCYYARTAEDLLRASKIILPGVGAFDHAMSMLNKSGLRETLDLLVKERQIPVLGICVGMQMMAESSDEGILDGLGWIKGTVRKFNHSKLPNNSQFPLPHMGWNTVDINMVDPLFKDFKSLPEFYYLHSYYFECTDNNSNIGKSDYGIEFSCIVKNENVYGIQCHPEKSHHNGVRILKNFAEL